MAYRTPARTGPGDTAVSCVRCAERTPIAFASSRDGDFRCEMCGHAQPVLPGADDVELTSLALKDYSTTYQGNYEHLRPFARELGRDVTTSGLDLVIDGIDCKIGLSIDSGSVVGLDHHARVVGLPQMRFLTELPEHVDAKARGVVKEVQTGDSMFDDLVYIESNATDADVLTVLASPAVRKAILFLLRGSHAIAVDPHDGISFSMARDTDPFEPQGIRERLRWLRVLAGAPRPLVIELAEIPSRARIAKHVVGWASPVGLFMFVVGLAKWTPIESTIVFTGLAGGLVLALAMLPVWTRLLRGRSTSHREILAWRITTFVFGPIFVAGLLVTINGAFDGSQERIVTMKIESVSKDDEDATFHTSTIDDRGGTHSYSFKSQPKVGQTLRVGWRSGALGWRWESSDATVVEASQ